MTEPGDDHKVVVAIDFGTHGTGYAWAEVSVLNRDQRSRDIHFYDRWRPSQVAYPKNLTALLLDPAGEVTEWGFAAKDHWVERLQREEADGWSYAYAFKMALKPDGGPDVATADGPVDLSDVDTVVRLVSAYLARIKDAVLAEIAESGWAMRHVRWCITVPAIWNDEQRDLMRRAAAGAGLPDDEHNLLIAIEPEAAALYCSLRLAQILDAEGSTDYLPLRAAGTRFMVVDCGGGTVDLTAHRTTLTSAGETRLDDIGRPTGGKLGSEYVNQAFRTTVLADRFGTDVLTLLEKKSPAGLAEIENQWETHKATLRAELGDDGTPQICSRVRIMVPGELWELLDDDVRARMIKHAGGIRSRIVVEPEELQRLLDTVVDQILDRIEQQLTEMRRVTETSGEEILLLIGGFARSEYLRLRVRHRFADRVTVMTPPDPAAAVLFGAVHFCYNPSLIRTRRSKLTYGFGLSTPFEPGRDPIEKKFKDDAGKAWCTNRFKIAVRNGQDVEIDDTHYDRVFPIMEGADALHIAFYATAELDPRYTDEPGCMQLATLVADISDSAGKPNEERGVGLYLYFGRTTIQAEAKVLSTGEKVAIKFEFRSRF
jgi:hypothetical protein